MNLIFRYIHAKNECASLADTSMLPPWYMRAATNVFWECSQGPRDAHTGVANRSCQHGTWVTLVSGFPEKTRTARLRDQSHFLDARLQIPQLAVSRGPIVEYFISCSHGCDHRLGFLCCSFHMQCIMRMVEHGGAKAPR